MTLATHRSTVNRTAPAVTSLTAPAADGTTSVRPLSALDRRLGSLVREHYRHTSGPVFPCPLCFEPHLDLAR